MNSNNFDKFPSIAYNPPHHSSVLNTPECMITTYGFADRFCNNLKGQASIDESVRSIQALIDEYTITKNR